MAKLTSYNAFFLLLYVLLSSATAFAADDVNEVADNIVESTEMLPGLISIFAYMGGLLLAVLGIFKTVEHVSNPTQTPIRVPIIRFMVGGALFALPIILEAAARTIGWGGAFNPDPGPIFTATGIYGMVSAVASMGMNFNSMLYWVMESIDKLPGFVAAVAYLLGVLMAVSGLYYVRDHVEDPDRVKLGQPVGRLIIAGALFALPTVFTAMFETIADGGLGGAGSVFAILDGFMWFRSTDTAALVDCSLFAGVGTSLGDAICYFVSSTMGVPSFLTGLAYLLGMVFGVWGLIKIRDHVNNPAQTGLNEGIMRLLAGGAFFALPVIVSVIQESISNPVLTTMAMFGTTSGYASDGSLTCTTTNSLDEMLSCFMKDITGPMLVAVNYFGFAVGMIFIMIGISRLVRSTQEGAKGPGGMGTVSTFIIGGLLCSSSTIVRTLSSSMFGDIQSNTLVTGGFTTGMSAAEEMATHHIINAVLRFMLIIGMISFVRGLFIVRDVSEGNQQASMMAATTHILGGALAINMGPLLNTVQESLGINAATYGLVFG